MHKRFERPKILGQELWEMFDPNETITTILMLTEKAKQIIDNPGKYSQDEIDQIQKSLAEAVAKITFIITQNLEWFREQELMVWFSIIDSNPSLNTWEENREYGFEILNYGSLINLMAIKASFASNILSILHSLNKS